MHSGTSFPVGKVDFLDLFPLNFFEFLNALGEEELVKLIKSNDFELIKVFSSKFIDYLKQYLYIGGMPEVVNAFIQNKDYNEVREIQNKLLIDYEQDFSKHAPNNIVPRNSKDVQNRREHFQLALAACENMELPLTELKARLEMNPEESKEWKKFAFQEWGRLLLEEQTLLKGIMKKDLERYKEI